jgi:osmotically-inducible protein OsmY
LADEALGRSVRDELSSDPKITVDADIRVSVADGDVTLHGTVASYGDKREAVRAAQRVRGVKTVRDEIEMVGRTDADLRRDVLDELEVGHIPATVDAEVHEGMVTLTGEVERQHHRDAAAFIAKVVPGVVGVENRLEVTGRSHDGEDVEDATRAAIMQIAELDAGGVAGGEDETRRELGVRLTTAARKIELLRSASEAGGNVVRFRLERYLEALESDAIDARSRLSEISDPASYDETVLERELTALETGVAVAEAKLDAARAAERDDLRGEMDAQMRAMKEEARGFPRLPDRAFGAKGRTPDPDAPGPRPDLP